MQIDFYLSRLQEVIAWEPIWRVLLRLGVDARFVLEHPGLHCSLDATRQEWPGPACQPLMNHLTYRETQAYLRLHGLPSLSRGRYERADAAVTTQGAAWLNRYRGLKLRTACGCPACSDVPTHSSLNRGLDGVFVHGEHCRDSVTRWVPSTDVVITGYPKFSAFFRGEVDSSTWKLRFRLDPGRKTVVYFTTWGGDCSLGRFAEAVAALGRHYNVLLKPHPMIPDSETKHLEPLRRTRGVHVQTREHNSVPFVAVADLVLADVRSGSFAEALLGGRPVIGLSMSDGDVEEGLLEGLLQAAPVCSSPGELGDLVGRLFNQDAYLEGRSSFARRLFTTFNGYDDEVTAAALVNLAVRKRPRWRVTQTV